MSGLAVGGYARRVTSRTQRSTLLATLLGTSALAIASAQGAPGWLPHPPPAAPGAEAPRLAASSEGPLLTWLDRSWGGAKALKMSRFRQGRWSPSVTITSGTDLLVNWADTPAVAEGGDGALYAAWLVKTSSHDYGAQVARSRDRGASWSKLGWLHQDRAGAEHGFVSMLKHPNGVRAFWLDGASAEKENGATTLRTALVGATVTEEREVDGRVCDCCSTSAVLGPRGPMVVYRDRSSEEIRDISIASGSDWRSASLSADGWKILGCPVNGPEIATDKVHTAVAWFTAAENSPRVYVAFSKDGGKKFGKLVQVDGGKPLGRVGLVLDGDHAIVSWLEHAGESAEIRVRRVAPNGRAGDPVRIATVPATRASGMPRILRDGDRLLVAWTDAGTGEASALRSGSIPLSSLPK